MSKEVVRGIRVVQDEPWHKPQLEVTFLNDNHTYQRETILFEGITDRHQLANMFRLLADKIDEHRNEYVYDGVGFHRKTELNKEGGQE